MRFAIAAHTLPTESFRFAIIGGGITGLTAAYRLSQLLPQSSLDLFESSDRLGGVLDTHRDGPLLVERGADSFINKLPWAVELCEELGLGGELIPTNAARRRALVLRSGRLYPVPKGFVVMQPQRLGPLLRTPLLSWRAKLRLLCEPWIRRPADLSRPDYDESVASFATRRLGRETMERLVQPLLAGIYTADQSRLSLAATMPKMIEAERQHGSLRRAIRATQQTTAQDAGARYASFVTPRHGLGQLVERLVEQLSAARIERNTPVDRVTRINERRLAIHLRDGSERGPYDGVLVATPAPCAAQLVEPLDSELSGLLRKISYASSAIVVLVYRRDQVAEAIDGFGFVVPTIERRRIIAASFSSVKFVGRAPDDQLLVRVFIGGAMQPELVDLPDEELTELACTELAEILGIRGKPLQTEVVRWREKMPQYHVGHVQLVDAIEHRVEQHPDLELAGNAYRGVGIPQCVRSGNAAARRLVESVQNNSLNVS